MVLIMSVNPGFGGQKFITSCLPKISSARAMIDRAESHALLEVDGGMKIDNVAQVLAAGADVLVAGSAIFSSKNYAATIAAMRAAGQHSSKTHSASPLTDRPRGWTFLPSSTVCIPSK